MLGVVIILVKVNYYLLSKKVIKLSLPLTIQKIIILAYNIAYQILN